MRAVTRTMAPVDRKKYAVDVLEHVLGGVRATTDETVEASHSEVVRLGVRPWLGLGTADPIRRPERPEIPSETGRSTDAYESDRRGEHKYAGERERPSHRQRRELKERLERER
jgi:hypothetical protein